MSELLPKSDKPFGGRIAVTTSNSKPEKPVIQSAPQGAPNVVVVLLDDVGFGAPGTFGGPGPTPALDALARQGLRYNQFHTTALCSLTRARCSPAATITVWELAPFARSAPAIPVTAASFRDRRRRSLRYYD